MQQNDFPVNKNLILTVTLIASFFNPFMGSAVNIALPKISTELSLKATTMSWIAMAYLLSSAVLMVPFGKLADIYGRKKIFLSGNIIFAAATMLCALSFNSETLLTGRLLQGIGSAMTFSTSMALIISAFPPQIRGRIIGYNVSAVYIGLSAAPILGGMLTQHLGWRSIFYMNAAAGFLVICLIIFGIRKEWAEARFEKFDYKGSILYTISITLLMYGFSKLPSVHAGILVLTGLTGMILFVIYESKVQFPVLNINLFRYNRVFAFSNLAALFNYAATFGITFLLSLYLQYAKGLNPHEAGFLLVTQPLFMAFFASFSGRLSDKYNPAILASIGMSIIVAGLIVLTFISENTHNYFIISTLALLGSGFGLFTSPNTNAIMSSVEKKYLGVASATTSTMRLTGQLISMAIATMLINLFVGNHQISSENIPIFIKSVRIAFICFACLCFLGIFASLARTKKQ